MSNVFKKIGQFFEGLFNAARKTYNKLSDEQKAALVHGSGLVAIINANIEGTPADVRAMIATKHPNLDIEKLEAALFKVAQSFGITDLQSADDAIAAIQGHLSGLSGKTWAVASHAAASLFSALFAPQETKVATIVSLIEFVYRHFIKKDLE
jgi:hypothetical protein